jgi:predicted glutamine amidotransferase
MCGIVGIFSTNVSGTGFTDSKIMRDMVTANSVRGYDGTGIFFLKAKDGYDKKDKQERLFYYKDQVTGTGLLSNQREWDDMAGDCRFVVGHNRAATLGKVNKENTHPFSYEHVIGVHNGTVIGWEDILAGHIKEADMDSSAIYEALNNTDPDPAEVGKLLGSLEVGAYALVWYDSRIKMLRFARNGDRPLYIANTEHGFIFGSELRMLEWIATRRKIRLHNAFSIDTHTVLDVPVEGGAASSYNYYADISYPTVTGYDDPWGDNYWTRGYSAYQQHYRKPATTTSYTPPSTLTETGVLPRRKLIGNEMDINALALDTVTKQSIKQSVRYLTGTSDGTGGTSMSYMQGLQTIFEGRRGESGYLPWTRAYIVGVEDYKYLAYVLFEDGTITPAAFSLPTSNMVGDHSVIAKALEEDKVVVIEASVIGVFTYAFGESAYALGNPSPESLASPVEIIEQDEFLKVLAIASDLRPDSHPEALSSKTDIGWTFGWAMH